MRVSAISSNISVTFEVQVCGEIVASLGQWSYSKTASVNCYSSDLWEGIAVTFLLMLKVLSPNLIHDEVKCIAAAILFCPEYMGVS